MNKDQRKENLLPQGTPRYIRCYDNGGETADRYTVVFTGRYKQNTGGEFWYVGMSGNPFHPLGIGTHGSSRTQIDYPSYGHLGKKVKFDDLTENCKLCVLQTYKDLWEIN